MQKLSATNRSCLFQNIAKYYLLWCVLKFCVLLHLELPPHGQGLLHWIQLLEVSPYIKMSFTLHELVSFGESVEIV